MEEKKIMSKEYICKSCGKPIPDGQRRVFNTALDYGYRSHQTQTCGLHIHVNRNAFGSIYALQESTVSRIVYFVEKHWNELLKFSRRTEANINRWANRYGMFEQVIDFIGSTQTVWGVFITIL